MGVAADLNLSGVLPPEPTSVGRARRMVASALETADRGDLVETAVLLVSEVVTNSVLHAGTEIRLQCHSRGPGVRIAVFDRSPVLPGVRHYDAEATTGRGLALVATLADSWGIDYEEDGKTLWFELGQGSDQKAPTLSPAEGGQPPVDGRAFTVRLCNASPALVLATLEYGDAMLRELALLALGGELDEHLPEGWHVPQLDISPILAAAGAATPDGNGHADLEVRLPAGAEVAAIDRLGLVDHADVLAREDRLLSAPALPEVGVCRHWLYTQIAVQAAGGPARPWKLPEPLEPARVAASLTPRALGDMEAVPGAAIVADDANRILIANDTASELLGWPPGALAGRRLTVVIPPELREAHLAGFTRLLVTGKGVILGKTVQVPALRRDGSRVAVDLRIERVTGTGGRTAFRATLAPTAEDGAAEPGVL